PDGEEGFPGKLFCKVTYILTHENELKISYLAQTTKATPINLTNHSYFNLGGAGSGDILGHSLRVSAQEITEVDGSLIPTGELLSVSGTDFDFTSLRRIGERFPEAGFDHNFVLNAKPSAELFEPTSGRK